MAQGRGELTKRVQETAKVLLGREITVRELRLMPYICNIMQNTPVIDQRKINDEERDIIDQWFNDDWLDGTVVNPRITEKYWMAFNALLFLAYVDLSAEA